MIAQSKNELMLRLKDGEDLVPALIGLDVPSGVILNGVGMLRNLKLGFWNGVEYELESVEEPVELLSLQGNFARKDDGELVVHCHATVAKRGGAAMGGHVLQATVHNTAEIFIHKLSEIELKRKTEESGLAGLYPTAIT
jgi:predicted DNA-binding protein with PD1-like motif